MFIPKIIHIIWIGPEKCPYKKGIQSYRDNNPDWEVKVWTDDNLPEIINKKVYEKMTSWAAKADVLRLELLYRFGGIYADADSVCLKPLDPLVENLKAFGMTGQHGQICNAFLGCTKNHPAFKKMVFSLNKHVANLTKTKRNKTKGTSIHSIAGGRFVSRIGLAHKDFTHLDKGLAPGGRKNIEAFGTKPDDFDGYVLQHHDNSWKKEGQGRIKL